MTGQGEVNERRTGGEPKTVKGERETVNWEQMKTRAQGAKTDDKYALTSNRDSARHKGRLTGKQGGCTGGKRRKGSGDKVYAERSVCKNMQIPKQTILAKGTKKGKTMRDLLSGSPLGDDGDGRSKWRKGMRQREGGKEQKIKQKSMR